MYKHLSLYEINTRVWKYRFNEIDDLSEIPESYWENLKGKGIDLIWLLGVWEIAESAVEKYCFEENLLHEYQSALKDFTKSDVIGSPFAINDYKVNHKLGNESSLKKLKEKLNLLGMKLILDFIPNHFSAESELIKSYPNIFLQVNDEFHNRDSHTYFKKKNGKDKYFAHGRDPFFPAWQDTIQVNYFNNEARKFMIERLKSISQLCDGVRCDMAMLALNNVFENTWRGVLAGNGFEKPSSEFWQTAIDEIKSLNKNFIFIAEAYWDLEWELQQLGFDYTYDKRLTDRLYIGDVQSIREHLMADEDFQKKSVRFIENHDEERAIAKFGKERSMAAAVVISTLQGMSLYHDGQFEGKRKKLPVQLGREPVEREHKCLYDFYKKLLNITSDEVFKYGKWSLLKPEKSWEGNNTYNNILAWVWEYKNQKRMVIINFSAETSTCKIKMNIEGYNDEFEIRDLLNNKNYFRLAEDVFHNGLYIELRPYKSHIFAY